MGGLSLSGCLGAGAGLDRWQWPRESPRAQGGVRREEGQGAYEPCLGWEDPGRWDLSSSEGSVSSVRG